MATTRAGWNKAADEEFLQQLYHGGELLAAGKVIEAKDYLERAYKLQPKNEKGQNLLGLTYFKLGLFDRAAEIYEALVRENPADPTLRVNLGLVYLKANLLQRAIREFETATDLAPEHKKAQNYLGLALAQAGEYGRAREHFLLAGSEAMAEKMSRAIAGETFEKPEPKPLAKQQGFTEIEGSEVVAERGGQQVEEEPDPADDADVPIDVDEGEPVSAAASGAAPAALTQQDWGAQFGAESPPPAAASGPVEQRVEAVPGPGPEQGQEGEAHDAHAYPPLFVEPAAPPLPAEGPDGRSGQVPVEAPGKPIDPGVEVTAQAPEPVPVLTPAPLIASAVPPGVEPVVSIAVDPAPAGPAPLLAETVPAMQLFTLPLTGPFQKLPDAVAVVVRDELLTRLTGLVAIVGTLELTPEPKRSRGRASDKPFGEGEQQVFRARGNGIITVGARKQLFITLDLGDESGYFREDVVFAFEEPVMFENGRVPSEVPPDLELVHLRGTGQVLLQLPGPLRSLEVRMDRPVTIPMAYLVGWHGNLTPRVLPLGVDLNGKPARGGVELSGEGFALFAVPV